MSREINKYDSMAKTYEDQSLTKNEKLIYVYLILLYNNTKQYAYPSYVSLKKALSTTRDDTVSKVIKSLEEKGYIKREIQPGRNTKYFLLKNVSTTKSEGTPLRKVKDNRINNKLNNRININSESTKDLNTSNKNDTTMKNEDSKKKTSKGINKEYIDLSYMEIDYVNLTQENYNKLVEKYGESNVKDKLIALDSYLANGIKKYKNHYKTLQNWLNKDVSKQPTQIIEKPKGKIIDFKIGGE